MDKPFSRTIKGTFNGKEYIFRNSGILSSITSLSAFNHITDLNEQLYLPTNKNKPNNFIV